MLVNIGSIFSLIDKISHFLMKLNQDINNNITSRSPSDKSLIPRLSYITQSLLFTSFSYKGLTAVWYYCDQLCLPLLFISLYSIKSNLELVCLLLYFSIYKFIHSFIDLFIYSFIYLFNYLFIYLVIWSFNHLFIYIYLFLFLINRLIIYLTWPIANVATSR